MTPKKDAPKSIGRTTGEVSGGFTSEERAAMKERAQKLKATAFTLKELTAAKEVRIEHTREAGRWPKSGTSGSIGIML